MRTTYSSRPPFSKNPRAQYLRIRLSVSYAQVFFGSAISLRHDLHALSLFWAIRRAEELGPADPQRYLRNRNTDQLRKMYNQALRDGSVANYRLGRTWSNAVFRAPMDERSNETLAIHLGNWT